MVMMTQKEHTKLSFPNHLRTLVAQNRGAKVTAKHALITRIKERPYQGSIVFMSLMRLCIRSGHGHGYRMA